MTSLRGRLTALFVASQAALLVLVMAGLLAWSHVQSETYAQHALQAMAGRLDHDAEGDNLQDSLAEELVGMRIDNLLLQIWDSQGHQVLQSGPPPAQPWRTLDFTVAGHAARLTYPWGPVQSAWDQEAALLAVLALAVLLTGGCGAWFLVGRSLAPIRELCGQVQATDEPLEQPLSSPSPDGELVQLVSTLNALLERARDTVRLKGRFYAAASHELRTPLQALSGHLELSLARPRGEAEYRNALQEAERQTARLTRLVRDLLFLTQLQSLALPPRTAVDVADVCHDVLEGLRSQVEARHLAVNLETPALRIEAPETHVEMLVRNLLENAVRYANEAGRVRVSTQDGLRVFDECTLPRPTEGTGLGLLICESLAKANGWTLQVQPAPEGLEAVVHFRPASKR